MNIYVIKPNFVSPDGMYFMKERVMKEYPDAEIMENQSGPSYDPTMITKANLLCVCIDKTHIIGKGVYDEYMTAKLREIPVRVFEYDTQLRELNEFDNHDVKIIDTNNYRRYGIIYNVSNFDVMNSPNTLT